MSNGIRSLPRYRHGGLHTKEENRRRAMAGERGYASIGPTPSWAERVAAQVRSVPRRINRALQPETAGETAALVGASMAEPLGTGIDIADIIAGARTGDIPRMGWGAAGLALPLVAGSALRKIAQRAARAADELPMDEASRMARAEEMEFDLDVYHASPHEIKGPFNRSSHPYNIADQSIGSGVYVAPSPKFAEQFATDDWRYSRPGKGSSEGGSIYPLKVRSKKLLSSESPEFKELVDDVIHNDPYFGPKTRDKTGPYFQPGGWGHSMAQERARKLAEEMGWEGFYRPKKDWIDGRWVTRSLDPKDADEIVIFDPKNLRSRWAVFDPAQAESADLLAGIVPLLGLGAAGAARRNYVERERSYE